MAQQIQIRNGTAAQWTTANPILAQGEMGLEIDTGKFKFGNGATTWVSLAYPTGIQGPAGPAGESTDLIEQRGQSEFAKTLDKLAIDTGNTTSMVPLGNHNPNSYSTLVTALQIATSGQTIRIAENSRIICTAQLPNLPVGVSLVGGGNVKIISNYAPAVSTSVEYSLLPVTSTSEGVNGNQTIKYISFVGNNFQAASAIYVRGRSNVKVYDCIGVGFNYNWITFNGRANETDGPATVKATGNGIYNCSSVACSTWVGDKPGGFASGILQVGSQIGFEIKDSIIISKGRGATNNGYGLKYYRLGYNESMRLYNTDFSKDPDDGTPSNFGFACELWNDNDLLVEKCSFEGWLDLNGLTKGTYSYGARFFKNRFGTDTLPVNTTTMGIELECASNVGGAPCSDILIDDNIFTNVRNALYIYQKSGTGTQRFANVTFINNKLLNTRLGEWVSAADEGGTLNWRIVKNTIRKTGSFYLHAGIKLPEFGNNTNWDIKTNIIVGSAVAPIWQAAPTAGVTSNINVMDNLLFDNGNSNVPMWGTTPTSYTSQNNIITDPIFTASDPLGMRNAYTGSLGAD